MRKSCEVKIIKVFLSLMKENEDLNKTEKCPDSRKSQYVTTSVLSILTCVFSVIPVKIPGGSTATPP